MQNQKLNQNFSKLNAIKITKRIVRNYEAQDYQAQHNPVKYYANYKRNHQMHKRPQIKLVFGFKWRNSKILFAVEFTTDSKWEISRNWGFFIPTGADCFPREKIKINNSRSDLSVRFDYLDLIVCIQC